MREIRLNGYIDEMVWFGDEITPEALHQAVYGESNQFTDDVRIILNSYGGDCNAATRMHDDLQAYPGHVSILISGTAASAATVVSMAAEQLEMTPGSLFMIHDPAVLALGNERDLMESIQLLRACKESILNVYARRCRKTREEVAALMTATTWMDANQALADGFVDAIAANSTSGPVNAANPHIVDRQTAETKVRAWLERRKEKAPPPKPEPSGTPILQLQKRLELLYTTK